MPSAFRAASSHTKEGTMPEISPLSQIQLLICSPVNRYLRQSDPCSDLSSSSPHLTSHALVRHPIQHRARPQRLPHLQRLSLTLHLAFPAILPVHWDSAPNASSLSTPATKPQPFSLNPFPLQDSAAAYLEHASGHGHPHHSAGRPVHTISS